MNDMITNAPTFSSTELMILNRLVDGRKAAVAADMGIPAEAIAQLLRRKGVKEFLAELKDAQREMQLAKAIGVVEAVLDDKLAMIAEDDDRRLGASSRKDPVEVAKTLAEMLKGGGSASDGDDAMSKIYSQINIIQQGAS